MKRFARLYGRLDETTKTNEKLAAMVEYFNEADDADAAWAVYFLSGNKLRRIIPSNLLRSWAASQAKIPEWLFEETYGWVGDLAEALSLVVPNQLETTQGSLTEWVKRLHDLGQLPLEEQSIALTHLWKDIGKDDQFVLMKMITGSMRVGVSQRLVTRALADHFTISPEIIAHRLMGQWSPTEAFYRSLKNSDATDANISQPYPFCLANPVEVELESLGSVQDFLAEWKWDGIRSQLIRRDATTFLWSRGEERLDGRYPEVEAASQQLSNDCVLDGELLAWKDGHPLSFGELQRRIGRKSVGKKLLNDVPVVFVAFDLLELDGHDLRTMRLADRRIRLEQLLDRSNFSTESSSTIKLSHRVTAESWEHLAHIRSSAREQMAEGLMLKHLESAYQVGRVRGHWWKWKIEPYTIDAVLIYAQRGHGRRASIYSDYTFALWQDDQLVPFAKAYSGLTDEEMRQVDRFVRSNTQDKFGPVRSVKPELVMELAFENIQLSNRHKSGLAVRFPRILRWRKDKRPADANQLEDLKRMVENQ